MLSLEVEKYHGQPLGPVVVAAAAALLVPALNNADVLRVKDWRCLVLDCKDLALSSSIEVGKLRKPLWHNK